MTLMAGEHSRCDTSSWVPKACSKRARNMQGHRIEADVPVQIPLPRGTRAVYRRQVQYMHLPGELCIDPRSVALAILSMTSHAKHSCLALMHCCPLA